MRISDLTDIATEQASPNQAGVSIITTISIYASLVFILIPDARSQSNINEDFAVEYCCSKR